MFENSETQIESPAGVATNQTTPNSGIDTENIEDMLDLSDDLASTSPLPALLSPVASNTSAICRTLSKRNSSVRSVKLPSRSASVTSNASNSLAKSFLEDYSVAARDELTNETYDPGCATDVTPEPVKCVQSDNVSDITTPELNTAENEKAEMNPLKRADTHILKEGATLNDMICEADPKHDEAAKSQQNDRSSIEGDPDECIPTKNKDEKSIPDEAQSITDENAEIDMDTAEADSTSSGPGPIEIVISFDTTGSMSNCLDEVKNRINDVINRLFMDIPSLKIGVIAHGDYCDEHVYYLTQTVDLTNDIEALCAFVRDVEGTGGGDFCECYELILRKARLIKWTPGSRRALIMIGDASPHTPLELKNEGREVINWVHEVTQLYKEQNVKVYGVQCMNHPEAGNFWHQVAALSGGQHLKLDTLDSIVEIIMAICYRERGSDFLDAYEKEVREREGRMLAAELDKAFGELRSTSDVSAIAPSTSGMAKVKAIGGAAKIKTPKKSPIKKRAVTLREAKDTKKTVSKVMDNTSAHSHLYKNKTRTTKSRKPRSKATKNIPVVYKQSREKVIKANFALNHLSWSKWGLFAAASPRDKSIIFYDILSFQMSCMRPAVYELSVQPKRLSKKYVVYARVTRGVKRNWVSALFGKARPLMEAVLHENNDAQIFIRRAFLGKSTQVRGVKLTTTSALNAALHKMYSYAWNMHIKSSSSFPCEKRLNKNGFNIC